MTTSDEFKAKLKAGDIADALTLAMGKAVELEITTWVSSANSATHPPQTAPQPTPNCRMRTRLNILKGEISNEVGSKFIGNGPYVELQQFHAAQVQKGRQTIQENLENLQQLFTIVTSTPSQLPQTSSLSEDKNQALSDSSQDNWQ